MRSTALSLRLAGAALLILAAAAPVAAADSAAPANSAAADTGGASAATPAAPAEKPKTEKKICRYTNATGSNLRDTKVCMTRAEWRARAE